MEHYHRDYKWNIIKRTTSGVIIGTTSSALSTGLQVVLSQGLQMVHYHRDYKWCYHRDYKWYIIIGTTSGVIIGTTSGTLS